MTRIPAAKRICHVGAISAFISLVLAAQSPALRIAVLSGEGAVYPAGSHVAKPLMVEVTDGAGRPVEGARISFQTPNEGPSGVFSSKLHTDVSVTDATGRAAVRELDLNRTPGPFSIRITAAKDQARAGVIVKQSISETKTVAATTPGAAATEVKAGGTPVADTAPAPIQAAPAAEAPMKPKIGAAANDSQSRSRSASVPTIVITQGAPRRAADPGASAGRKSHKKWIWIAVLAAAGAAGAVAGPGLVGGAGAHGSTITPGTPPAVSIGPPTISIGKP